MKKAQGLSLNVIIIAVLALVVLVVSIAIYYGVVKEGGEQTAGYLKCETSIGVKGECGTEECEETEIELPGRCGEGTRCCVRRG